MKSLRPAATFLLMLTGVVKILLYFGDTQHENSQPVLVFGIFYFVIGALMFSNKGFSAAWGIIFPLIGFGAGLFAIGFQNWDIIHGLLIIIDAIIVVCFSILFIDKK
jgi:hypothetical protein